MAGKVTETPWGKCCAREIPRYSNKYFAGNNFGGLRLRFMSPIIFLFRDAESKAKLPSEFSVKRSALQLPQVRDSELDVWVRVAGYTPYRWGPCTATFQHFCCCFSLRLDSPVPAPSNGVLLPHTCVRLPSRICADVMVSSPPWVRTARLHFDFCPFLDSYSL